MPPKLQQQIDVARINSVVVGSKRVAGERRISQARLLTDDANGVVANMGVECRAERVINLCGKRIHALGDH